MSSIAAQFDVPVDKPVDTRSRRLRVAENIFLFLIGITLVNIASLFVRFRHGQELAINPLLVMAAAIAIMIARLPKKHFNTRYFAIAGLFVALMVMIGTVSMQNFENTEFKTGAQIILKIAINFLLIPWMGMRLASPQFIRRCFHMVITITAVGGLFALVQFVFPAPFEVIIEAGRGAGFWVNPNTCGTLCLFVLLITFIWPLPKPAWNWMARISLILGILACSSRAVLGAVVLAIIVYLLLRRDLKTAVFVAVSAALGYVLLSSVNVGDVLGNFSSDTHRAASFAKIASGEAAGAVTEDIRWKIWQYASSVVMDNWVAGCGMNCMNHVAPFGGRGLGPHNFYLYVWGTSGIFALMAFLFLLGSLIKWGLELQNPSHRALSVAVVVTTAFLLIFDHSSIVMQPLSPLFLFFAVFSVEGASSTR